MPLPRLHRIAPRTLTLALFASVLGACASGRRCGSPCAPACPPPCAPPCAAAPATPGQVQATGTATFTIAGTGTAVVAAPEPTDPLERLVAGNRRYVSGHPMHPDGGADRRAATATTQVPFAIVLGCADSRVGPELVFDQGIGDLFVVRVAGNIAEPGVLGSIEYAAEHLHTTLLVVLGHERCGAVAAALAGGEAPGNVKSLVEAIQPAVASSAGEAGDKLDNAVRANVRLQEKNVRAMSPILDHLIADGTLRVVGARYDLDTGEVELLK